MLVSLYEEGICKTQYDLWYNIPNIINIDKKHFVSLLKEMMQNQMGDSVRLNISDEDIIENTLIYLDIEDINILFRIYPLREIKKVWAETMAIQDNRYKDINRFIAGCYFGVKHPDSYVKRVKTHELNKRYL